VVAQNVAFWILAIAMAGAAIGVVRSQNVVHAALYLVVVLAGAAAQYILLAAEFVAWVQVLIYVGAVVVLLLFALMLTRAPTGPQPRQPSGRAVPAVVVAVLVAALLGTTVVAGFGSARIDLRHGQVGTAQVTGQALFRTWVLPFEVLSVLLLAALVGAIVLSRLRSTESSEKEGA
jgi:NADH-quinone oxidoreductase subunit J